MIPNDRGDPDPSADGSGSNDVVDRGQSTLDFLLGTVIFLLAVVVVVAVVPGMLDPFATGTESHPVAADRAVSTLVTDEFSEPTSPYLATSDRVSAVFERDVSTLETELALPSTAQLNVTFVTGAGMLESVGETPPSSASVTTAWRVVSFEGAPANVTVRVW